MKILLITLAIVCCSFNNCKSQSVIEKQFKSDFNVVADTYEEKLKPYLRTFSEIQYEESKENANLIEARYRVYIQKMENLRNDSYDFLYKKVLEKDTSITKKFLIEYFDTLYRNNFTGLDYKYFSSVEKSLN